jgi:hypothetical protein
MLPKSFLQTLALLSSAAIASADSARRTTGTFSFADGILLALSLMQSFRSKLLHSNPRALSLNALHSQRETLRVSICVMNPTSHDLAVSTFLNHIPIFPRHTMKSESCRDFTEYDFNGTPPIYIFLLSIDEASLLDESDFPYYRLWTIS